jgi:type I restriction enzyme S subunit
MKTHVFLRDVLTEIKSGIGSDWAKYPVLEPPGGDWPPRKNPRARIRSDTSPYFREPYFITRCVSVAFVDEGDEPGITSPDYVVFQGKDGKVNSRWFYYWLRSPLGHQTIPSLARGAVRENAFYTVSRGGSGTARLPHAEKVLSRSPGSHFDKICHRGPDLRLTTASSSDHIRVR